MSGCVATGASAEAAEKAIQEAIELHLVGMREDGIPVPQPSSRVEYVEVAA
ncbi:MAG: type II toxin-antitoxin system HicB family antitoxin [Pseudomonadota bacterium]